MEKWEEKVGLCVHWGKLDISHYLLLGIKFNVKILFILSRMGWCNAAWKADQMVKNDQNPRMTSGYECY